MEKNKMMQYDNPLFFRYLLIHSERIRRTICKELNEGREVKQIEIVNKKHYSHLMNQVIMEDEEGMIYMVEFQHEVSKLDYMARIQGYQGFLFRESRINDVKRDVRVLVIHYETSIDLMKAYKISLRLKENETPVDYPFKSYYLTTIELDHLVQILDSLRSNFDQLMYLLKVGKPYNQDNELIKEVIEIHENYLDDENEEIRYFYFQNDRTLLQIRDEFLDFLKRELQEKKLGETTNNG